MFTDPLPKDRFSVNNRYIRLAIDVENKGESNFLDQINQIYYDLDYPGRNAAEREQFRSTQMISGNEAVPYEG